MLLELFPLFGACWLHPQNVAIQFGRVIPVYNWNQSAGSRGRVEKSFKIVLPQYDKWLSGAIAHYVIPQQCIYRLERRVHVLMNQWRLRFVLWAYGLLYRLYQSHFQSSPSWRVEFCIGEDVCHCIQWLQRSESTGCVINLANDKHIYSMMMWHNMLMIFTNQNC